MPNPVKIKLIPPPPPVSLGEVQLTMPVETAIALAGVLAYMPLSAIDNKLDTRDALFNVFAALHRAFVLEPTGVDVSELYAEAKAAFRSVVKITRVDHA